MGLFKVASKSKRNSDENLEKILSKVEDLKKKEILIKDSVFERRKYNSTIGENEITTYTTYNKNNAIFGVINTDRVILEPKKIIETTEEHAVLIENNENNYCINLLRIIRVRDEKFTYIRAARICMNDKEEIEFWQRDPNPYLYKIGENTIDYNRLKLEKNNLKDLMIRILNSDSVAEKVKYFIDLSSLLSSYLECFELKNTLKKVETNLDIFKNRVSSREVSLDFYSI